MIAEIKEKQYSVRDIMFKFDVSRQTVDAWIKAGWLDGSVKGDESAPRKGKWIIPASAMRRLQELRCDFLQSKIDELAAERDRLAALKF